MPVDALLTQDRNGRTRARRDERRRGFIVGIEGKPRRQPGVHIVQQALEFAVGGLGIVAQPLHRMRRRGPGAMEIHARLIEDRAALLCHADASMLCGFSNRCCVNPVFRCESGYGIDRRAWNLRDGAELFGE